MLCKRGKLPGEVVGLNYALEYGEDRIEIQADAVEPGARVVILELWHGPCRRRDAAHPRGSCSPAPESSRVDVAPRTRYSDRPVS